MPLTTKGKKIMRSMKEEYGPKRGEQVFYASKNKGAIKGVERMAQGGSVAGKKFPDLTGDGKVTKKDILKGRGVEGFKKGGKVSKTAAMEDAYETEKKVKYARVPMEPVSGKEPDALEDAMRYERRRAGDTKTYRDGGMVRGCKGVQTSGKGFKGTF